MAKLALPIYDWLTQPLRDIVKELPVGSDLLYEALCYAYCTNNMDMAREIVEDWQREAQTDKEKYETAIDAALNPPKPDKSKEERARAIREAYLRSRE